MACWDPNRRRSNEPLAVQVGQVVKRLSALPLERVVDGLDSLISPPGELSRIRRCRSCSPTLLGPARRSPLSRTGRPEARAAAKMAEEARANFAEMQELLDRSRALPEEFERMLEQLTATARSLRVLTEMLERHPEAMLRGRSGGG